jgi:PAS domain S-box-containing protein
MLSLDGTLLQANAAVLEAANLKPEDVVGKKFWDCYWWAYDAQVAAELRAAIDLAATGQNVRYNVKVRIAEGHLIDIDFSLVAARNDQGVITYLIPSGIDISAAKSAEQARHESEAFTQSLFENSGDCIKTLDSDGCLLSMNKPGMCLMEIDDFESVRGKGWWTLWPASMHETIQEHLRRVFHGQSVRFRGDCLTAKGGCKSWDVVLTPVLGRQRELVKILCISRDVTIEQRQHIELQERESQFRTLADNVSQLAWMADHTGWIYWYNQRWFDYTGTTLDEMQGWGWRTVHHPDHVARVVAKIKTCFAEGIDWEDTFPLRCKDGSYRWFLSRMKPIRANDGSIVRWIGTNTDITESLKAEDALRRSEQKLQLGIEVARVGIAEIDYATGLVALSKIACSIYGLDESDNLISRQRLHELIHPDDRGRFSDRVKEALSNPEASTISIEHKILRRNGDIRWVEVRKRVLFDINSKVPRVTGAVLALQDITEQKEFEINLQQARLSAESASRAKTEFLANMSHEIRSPMTAILGYAELLRGANDEDIEKIKTIQRNGQFLLSLINDILDLSKIEAGKLQVDKVRFRPRGLIEEVTSLMNVRAIEGKIALQSDFKTWLPREVSGDPIRVRQILINLVGNAIKFTEEGEVRLVTSYDQLNEKIRIDITDTGIGMEEETLRRIFRPFEQADSSIVQRFGGTGLGLAISTRLAELMGAKIEVESVFEKGSTFSLILPVQSPDLRETESVSETNLEFLDRSQIYEGQFKIHALVVDDRRDIRFLVHHYIQRVGGQTTLCENGQEAVDAVLSENSSNPFDVILMDVQMPVMDGMTAVRRLRELGFDRPIIALTANAKESDRDACLLAGFTSYLSKPISSEEMFSLLRRLLSGA